LAFAARAGYEIAQEFVDDGVSGKTYHMHARPAGKLLIAALLGNGVRVVICDKGSRIGRQQHTFWSFIGMARDNGIVVLDSKGTNLCESVQGGMNAIMAEMEYDQTVSRLARGKKHWREQGRRVEGRWPFGAHPSHDYDSERETVRRITDWKAQGVSNCQIVRNLAAEGVQTRYGKAFTASTITRILEKVQKGTKDAVQGPSKESSVGTEKTE
jgi:DNA invertase Pin-like site-specific DNA recombinase